MVPDRSRGYVGSRRVEQESQEIDPLIGQLVTERYRIVRKIGEGGMGTVYEAHHEAIEKRIALKVLHEQYSSSPEVLERFKQEAVSASRIKHQNVIDVFDFGQLPSGACFIAMEYLDGMDLGDALQKRGAFPADEAIRITIQICRALGLGHTRGVVHRDLKPENIFLQRTLEGDEVVKIVDFGIAQLRSNDEAVQSVKQARQRRLTKTGMIFGTPEYMAPEQARGQDVDHRSDIYSTGIILYELLTGAVPFLGESFLEVLNKQSLAQVPPLNEANADVVISKELSRVVYRALEKEPDDRFPAMKELSSALLRTPEGRSVRSHISSISSREDLESDDELRLENASVPAPKSGDGTAMFGSPGAPALEGSESVPVHSQRGLTAAVVGVSALILAIGAYVAFGGEEQQKEPLAEAIKETTPAPSPAPTPAPAEPEQAPEASPAPTPEKVQLRISSQPTGAVVKKDGFQVCEATPCELRVEQGEALSLTAELGKAKGEAKVLAQSDQGVSIKLIAPATPRPRPRPATPTPNPAPAMCEVMVDGLKILRPCQ